MQDWRSEVKRIVDDIMEQRRIPSSTYRLQFNHAFAFRDACTIVRYLHDLGVGDCYASPLLRARPDSNHGYDICDYSQINPVLGGETEFSAFVEALHGRGMGLILDTVPNHMVIFESSNPWWMDILENGPGSSYARYFDIDWHPVTDELENKVLLPVLEDQYGNVLESGKLRLALEDGAFFVYHYETKLPITPRTYEVILNHNLDQLKNILAEDDENLQEMQSIITAVDHLPPHTELDAEKIAERNREKEVIKRRIAALYGSSPEVRAAIDEAVKEFNGAVGAPRSFDLLDSLIDAQPYRLAYWRVAAEEINYRRFFDVNHLAAIRVELPEVFQAAHQVVLELLACGKVNGLRVDHPDGLHNPTAYFRQLQENYVFGCIRRRLGVDALEPEQEALISELFQSLSDRNQTLHPVWPLYVIAEKVLAPAEPLPEEWAIDGTTGYQFLNDLNGLFVDPRGGPALERIYARFIGHNVEVRQLISTAKKTIMMSTLSSEINSLSHQVERITKRNRYYRDFTLNSLTFAIREVITCLSVYRTYVTGSPERVSDRDILYIETAVAEAKRRNPTVERSVFNFIRDTLLLRNLNDFNEEDRSKLISFVLRFQQVTGPVMAKALEDTVFYVYHRLVSLNEVGGHPANYGFALQDFHRVNAERQLRWPHAMLTTSTHDTKRSEDVRARINVLSEIPNEWWSAINRWRQINGGNKTLINGEASPDANDEYLFYQTLLGVWPVADIFAEGFVGFRERIVAYMLKAVREAKVHTSWLDPDEAYEAALHDFIFRVLAADKKNAFRADFTLLQSKVAYFGQFNSLSQALIKFTSPGVPDIYQGNELWDFSLVDPDNRRPVDFQLRRSLLSGLKKDIKKAGDDLTGLAEQLLRNSGDGSIKLYVTYRALNFRRSRYELFANGSYIPLETKGFAREHIYAFARSLGTEVVITVVPRLVARLAARSQSQSPDVRKLVAERPPVGNEIWRDSWLFLGQAAAGVRFRNLFTGEILEARLSNRLPGLPISEILGHFPVALLERIR